MIIRLGDSYNPVEEAMLADRAKARTEDGRTAPVSGSELGLDAGGKADEAKKTVFAAAGDRVDISREARELLQAQAAENPGEEERQGADEQDEYAEFAEAANNLKGLSEKFQSPATAGMSGAGGSEDDSEGGGSVDKLRKMIKEAQKKLADAQLKLQEALAKASSEEDSSARQLAQGEVQAAQQEMAVMNAEIQMLQQRLQEAMKSEAGGGGGSGEGGVGKIGINPASGWAPSGKRIQVGANGIASLT
ncbi:MAG: hypothetical protein LBM64_10560 [Deltaproteobacteria bacterium]|jgi:hypothetical protein|nr:hypothetical protein [Deltaproteobacteria bacterium]